MQIKMDKETYCDHVSVARGLSHVAPLKVCFQARPEVNTRIMDAIAQEFKVYQYVDVRNGGIPYESAWDFFFWCNSFEENPMNYFTLSSHHDTPFQEFKRSLAERENDFIRLRDFLESHFRDEDCDVSFEWHTELDADAITAEAKRIYEEMGNGKMWVDYRGQVGRLYYSREHGYYFKKKGAKKYVLELTRRAVCRIHKWEKIKAA